MSGQKLRSQSQLGEHKSARNTMKSYNTQECMLKINGGGGSEATPTMYR